MHVFKIISVKLYSLLDIRLIHNVLTVRMAAFAICQLSNMFRYFLLCVVFAIWQTVWYIC